jgi:hypothetical protein
MDMLPPTCIVVPTYWTREGGVRRAGDAVYDHPTALGGENTLEALLASLGRLDTHQFYVLLLVAVTAGDVAVEAEHAVRALADRHPDITSMVFGSAHLQVLHAWLVEHRLEHACDFLGLQQYPKIRNLQLALPLALRSRAIVALDDDEIVNDPEFLRKATVSLGLELDGEVVQGLSGHYEQDDGSILLKVDPVKATSTNLFDRKASIMNEASDMLEAEPGQIVKTPFCFGGNMEFAPEMARSVGFDPGITRGEDIDYLINARMEGKSFYLRKDLRILHCPPKGGSYQDASTSKLEQDIIRFLYERKKLVASREHPALHPVMADDLMPYPGKFLDGDLEHDACQALEAAGYDADCAAFVASARTDLDARVSAYLLFRERWPVVMEALSESAQVRDQLMSYVRNA